MGGVPGCSIEHYIVKMVNFILTSMDGNPNIAVLAVPVDFSKAFNRMLHSDVISNLSALNVPPCATKLIQSYLTKRSMCVRYQKAESTFKSCPGGGPQGGLLTGVLFILQVNKAGGPCHALPSLGKKQPLLPANTPTQAMELYRGTADKPSCGNNGTGLQSDMNTEEPVNKYLENPSLGNELTRLEIHSTSSEQPNENCEAPTLRNESILPPLCHSSKDLHKKSFVDDLTLLEKINLSKLRRKNRIVGPPNYHDRFHLELPAEDSILQHQLEDLKRFTQERSMKINSQKNEMHSLYQQ